MKPNKFSIRNYPLSILNSQLSIVLAVILLSISIVHAQEVHLHFPHFTEQTYNWKIFQGPKPTKTTAA